MRTIAEITTALDVRYAGPIEEKRGFQYIPWNEAFKQANRIFGIDGYSVETLKVWREGAGYASIVRVTVTPSDSKPFHRDGVGFNDLTSTNAGAEMTDTAIKGAASDAANRAFKLFGEAFGLHLYDKAKTTPTNTATPRTDTATSRPTAAGNSGRASKPTEKQIEWLEKKGVSAEEIDGMTFEDAKARLDILFNGGGKKAAPAAKPAPKAAPKPAPVAQDEEPDDLDSFFN